MSAGYFHTVFQHPVLHIERLDDQRFVRIHQEVSAGTLLLVEQVMSAPWDILATVVKTMPETFNELAPRHSILPLGEIPSDNYDEEAKQKVQTNAFKCPDGENFILGQTISIFNHRCNPNAVTWFDKNEGGQVEFISVYALTSMSEGEQVFISYGTNVHTSDWGFECGCGLSQVQIEEAWHFVKAFTPSRLHELFIDKYIHHNDEYKKIKMFQCFALDGRYGDTLTSRYLALLNTKYPGIHYEVADFLYSLTMEARV